MQCIFSTLYSRNKGFECIYKTNLFFEEMNSAAFYFFICPAFPAMSLSRVLVLTVLANMQIPRCNYR